MTRMSASKVLSDKRLPEESDHAMEIDQSLQVEDSSEVETDHSFSLGEGELTLDKVETLLGIQGSGKSATSTNLGGLTIKLNKKSSKRKSEPSSVPSLLRSGGSKEKVPKVTLKFGMPTCVPASLSITNSNISLNSNGSSSTLQSTGINTGITAATLGSLLSPTGSSRGVTITSNSIVKTGSIMKSRAISTTGVPATTPSNGSSNTQVTISVSNEPVSSGGSHGSRTPGTPSDLGGSMTNPATPGNGNSSMVNSPHQYVTISVDGESSVGNDGGVNAGSTYVTHTYADGSTTTSTTENSSIYAAANGQTMAYPVYNVGESGTMFTTGSSQYYSGSGSATATVSFGQDDVDDDDGPTNGGLTTADLNSILSCGSGDSSLLSSSPEADLMHQHQHALIDGGVYMVPSSNNNNSGASESEGPSNLTHASTRVSPFTHREKRKLPSLKPISKKKSFKENKSKEIKNQDDSDDDEEEDKQEDSEEDISGYDILDDVPGESLMNNLLSDVEIKQLAKLYPLSRMSEFGGGSNSPVKACPQTVQWLIDNYETAEGVSLPRYTLYNHYLRHCSENKLDPVNAASFGKLIRSVFVGLRTRRLGTRGNSKYHYYGIRVKPNSPLIHLPDDFPPGGQMNRSGVAAVPGSSSSSGSIGHQNMSNNNTANMAKRLKTMKSDAHDGSHTNGFGMGLGESVSVQDYLGDPTGVLDEFPEIDIEVQMPEGISEDDLLIFRSLYREHCESLLEALANFQLLQIESLWRFFWRSTESSDSSLDFEKILPKTKLLILCGMKTVQSFVKESDYSFYQKMVSILLPDVLRPIPSTMTQTIRNFAKTLENSLTQAMAGYPDDMMIVKIAVVSSLSQTLRRYTSLNHLAQAARAVLQNQNQITQMLSDLNRVDFHNVEEQASWVCGCDGDLVPNLEQDFKSTLAQQQSLEQWAVWLEGVVDRILRPYVNTPKFVQAARHFLLKWSFYSSLVIRDLTLRSAASFGSFHLLRLLYDEYMFYLVEHRVAQVTGMEPIAVIGSKKFVGPSNNLIEFPSTASGIEGSDGINGHTNGETQISSNASTASTEQLEDIPSNNPSCALSSLNSSDMIVHTNNNTTTSTPFGTSSVIKSEFRRSKNFLTS